MVFHTRSLHSLRSKRFRLWGIQVSLEIGFSTGRLEGCRIASDGFEVGVLLCELPALAVLT